VAAYATVTSACLHAPSTSMERTLHMPCSSDPFMWASTRAKGHRPVRYPGWHMGWSWRRAPASPLATAGRLGHCTKRVVCSTIPFYIRNGGARTEQAGSGVRARSTKLGMHGGGSVHQPQRRLCDDHGRGSRCGSGRAG
jgi:hypothetical protein